MSIRIVVDVCNTQAAKIVKFFISACRSPPVASLEQRHDPPSIDDEKAAAAAKQLDRRHTYNSCF